MDWTPNILSQSVGVKGSICTVCASGGSTCNETATYPSQPISHIATTSTQRYQTNQKKKINLTFIPSLNPTNRPNVPSTSTPCTSDCSSLLVGPAPAALRVCERMPVHPKNTDCCFPSLPAACLKLSSTTTFCTTALEFSSTLTSGAGRLSRQFLSEGRRETSAWEEGGGLRGVEAMVFYLGLRVCLCVLRMIELVIVMFQCSMVSLETRDQRPWPVGPRHM